MTLGERLKTLRKAKGLSQEKVAEIIGVSRQAVTKWEVGQSAPSSENLLALAALFNTSLDELVAENVVNKKKTNLILRANLTMLPIAFQTGALHACTQSYTYIDGQRVFERNLFFINLGLLFVCSLWMTLNLRREKDLNQRRRNSHIELIYCTVQLIIAFLTFRFTMGLVGLLLNIIVCLIYIFAINPKYMNRTFTKPKS